MRNRTVASRYARALLDSASAAGVLDGVADSFKAVMAVIDGKPDLLRFLAGPHIEEQKKRELLDAVFGDRIEAVLLHFFLLLIGKQRMDSLPEVHTVFQGLVEVRNGFTRAVVTTAVPLPADLETELVEKLSGLTGTKIVLRKEVDPAVMGGACVRMGDEVIDGTIRTNLARMRAQLMLTNVR